MSINFRRARECLQAFDWGKLFVEYLGWGHAHGRATTLAVGEYRYHLTPIAELGGMVVFTCAAMGDAPFPPTHVQRRIDRDVSKIAHEHLTIFMDAQHTKATWLWMKRGIQAPVQARTHTYQRGQPGDALLVKVAGIVFRAEDLDDEGRASVVEVTKRVAGAFDVERVTKQFYKDFKDEHDKFLKAIDGIADADDRAWYTSVMLNRLMFVYFIQWKDLLDRDREYLKHKLAVSKRAGANRFYREFLTTLFFEGFAREEPQRPAETRQLLGRIPYLNGGLFTRHQLEQRDGQVIRIPDRAFERLFEFFDKWDWVLEPREPEYYFEHRDAKEEINPDVLGYIFEKYINQKEMGAYYTKEDITGYICRNTILPFLMDKLGNLRYAAVHPLFQNPKGLAKHPRSEAERGGDPSGLIDAYIYPAVSQQEYLPTETEREYAARQKRYQNLRGLGDLEGFTINDFITYNLDIEAFVQDYLEGLTDPMTLRAFYFECLKKLTVLDPTVGSGAFLFAAMGILGPLYEICLDKMKELASPRFPDFAEELARIAQHPNRAYFIFKSIIVNNLYGVDISEEATEICKLRLFLKLVAQVERDDAKPNLGIEPLPDIDFNIQAGNTLIGYASLEEVEEAGKRSLFATTLPNQIREADVALRAYRALQTQLGISARDLADAKKQTAQKLAEIENALNESLSAEYGARRLEAFVKTHQPLHWYVEFNQIMQDGGFDVIVGNPPYVEYSKVRKRYTIRGYETERCDNLYAFVMERALHLTNQDKRFGFIVPLSFVSTDGFASLRTLLCRNSLWISNFAIRPAKLFEGVEHRLTIVVTASPRVETEKHIYATRYRKWSQEERPTLLELTNYGQVTALVNDRGIPKLGSEVEISALKKFSSNSEAFRTAISDHSAAHKILYTRKFGHFVLFTSFIPSIRFEDGSKMDPTELKSESVTSEEQLFAYIAHFNSTLTYWYLTTVLEFRVP